MQCLFLSEKINFIFKTFLLLSALFVSSEIPFPAVSLAGLLPSRRPWHHLQRMVSLAFPLMQPSEVLVSALDPASAWISGWWWVYWWPGFTTMESSPSYQRAPKCQYLWSLYGHRSCDFLREGSSNFLTRNIHVVVSILLRRRRVRGS